MAHPHLHCLIPDGGLSLDGTSWIPVREGFFIPVKVVSRLFRGKFLHYLRQAFYEANLTGPSNRGERRRILDELHRKEWVVYCKPPFGGASQVLEYLGRYTHRVAIANHRLVEMKDGRVTFWWRDYGGGDKNKLMTLDAHEFIRRFLLHILPDGFVKIRHYGIMSNRSKGKLEKCREILGVKPEETQCRTGWKELFVELTGMDL